MPCLLLCYATVRFTTPRTGNSQCQFWQNSWQQLWCNVHLCADGNSMLCINLIRYYRGQHWIFKQTKIPQIVKLFTFIKWKYHFVIWKNDKLCVYLTKFNETGVQNLCNFTVAPSIISLNMIIKKTCCSIRLKSFSLQQWQFPPWVTSHQWYSML